MVGCFSFTRFSLANEYQVSESIISQFFSSKQKIEGLSITQSVLSDITL